MPCGQSVITARRSDLFGYAGSGYCAAHSRWHWGTKLMLIATPDGTVTRFGLANPKLAGERDEVQQMLTIQPANRPCQGTFIVADKGFAGEDFEEYLAGPDLDLTLIRPARKNEQDPGTFPNWLRQRIIWTLKHQLGLEHHGGLDLRTAVRLGCGPLPVHVITKDGQQLSRDLVSPAGNLQVARVQLGVVVVKVGTTVVHTVNDRVLGRPGAMRRRGECPELDRNLPSIRTSARIRRWGSDRWEGASAGAVDRAVVAWALWDGYLNMPSVGSPARVSGRA